MGDYCGWCAKQLAEAEKSSTPEFIREVGKRREVVNVPLCTSCRDKALSEGFTTKERKEAGR